MDRIDQEAVFCQELAIQGTLLPLTETYLKEYFPELQATEAFTVLQAFFLSRVINHLIAPIQNKIMAETIEKMKQDSKEIYAKNNSFLVASLS
ncbi:TPA: helix-turn-helix domain-containing protein, partial [Enterococcus faecium]